MPRIHWLNDGGAAEGEAVCNVDFADDGMAIDFAHNLYRSVHAFGRSKPGFAITSDTGRWLYAWRWDDGVIDLLPTEDAKEAQAVQADIEPSAQSGIVLARPVSRADKRRFGRAFFAAFAGLIAGRRSAKAAPMPAAHQPQTPERTADARSAVSRHFAPHVALKSKRWRPEIDHYLLALIVVLAILCGSPLCSIYATVQHLLRDEAFLHQDRTVVAVATRDATQNVLLTDGKLDFRKLFWHLRLVSPTEIHLLAYEPNNGQGPKLIFRTGDLLRWHLQSVRGADGTWWARSDTNAGKTREG